MQKLFALNSSRKKDFVDCFTSHRNVRVTCVEPVEQKTLSTVTQCEELCLTQPTVCRTAQYDLDKSTCEIFSAPPLLGSEAQKTRRRFSRNADSPSKAVGKCAPALQPSIGTIYLVPRQECFEEPKQTSYVGDGNEKILGAGLDRSQLTQQPQLKPPRDPFSTIPVEVLPIVPDCPLGEKARVQIIDGVEVKHSMGTGWGEKTTPNKDGQYVSSSSSVTFKADSPEKCVHACMTSSVRSYRQ
ncbi:PAN domain protein [Ancylostoma caninum]|uniref:PAN domain protein n=1 Tax=Ancylostoma caninum TaxID=29170 RepID=A0A368FCZ3_ANCCA|nr:PAN domain protein [Ancylostoma caninum]